MVNVAANVTIESRFWQRLSRKPPGVFIAGALNPLGACSWRAARHQNPEPGGSSKIRNRKGLPGVRRRLRHGECEALSRSHYGVWDRRARDSLGQTELNV